MDGCNLIKRVPILAASCDVLGPKVNLTEKNDCSRAAIFFRVFA